ncbi:MAG: hypothetical protein HYV96_06530 [Opitutae bacterium]|nr:hypothetical protein [Opitutae bacterium]
MPSGETPQHARLKSLALAWARANGFALAECEVRVPRSGFRADVVALDAGAEARVAVFECKQSRADLRKDAHDETHTRAAAAALREREAALEAMLAMHRPECRRGDALWPEFDSCDFSGVEHRTYARVRRELRTLQRRMREGTKFSRMARYRCADFLWLVVEDDIFAAAEVPARWGLLVRVGEALVPRRAAERLDASSAQRDALRRNLEIAAGVRVREPRGGPELLFAESA